MPKEHAGGLERNGHTCIAVDWQDDQPFAVKIEYFDYEALDRLEDLAREALAKGRLKEFLDGYVATQTEGLRCTVVKKVLDHIIHCKRPKFKVICMAIAAGHGTAMARTEEEWAADFGVSKQDLQEAVETEREEFRLRKTRLMRDEEAREKMRTGNFRPKEQVAK